jgi:hypothetical protein
MDVHSESGELVAFSINCQTYNKSSVEFDNDSINGEVLMTRLYVNDDRQVLLTFAVKSSRACSVLFGFFGKGQSDVNQPILAIA